MSEELDPNALFDAVRNQRAKEDEAVMKQLAEATADTSRRPLPGEALPEYLKRMVTEPEAPLGGRTPTQLEQEEMARGGVAQGPVPAQLGDITIDGVLEIETDGMPNGTTVRVDGKILRMVQSLRLEITPDGVRVNLAVLCPKLKLKGRVVTLERADPPEAATAVPSGGQAVHVPIAPGA